jgi:hypothetical protein
LINNDFPKNFMDLNRNLLQMPLPNVSMHISNEAQLTQTPDILALQESILGNSNLDVAALR